MSVPITESVIEARMQPRSDDVQRCLHFALTTSPPGRVMMYQDHDGNSVHHFDIPTRHARLTLTADALVECVKPKPLPHRLGPGGWAQLDDAGAVGRVLGDAGPEHVRPHNACSSRVFAQEHRLERGNDPLVVLRRLMTAIYTRLRVQPAEHTRGLAH